MKEMREIKFRAWHKADEKMYKVYGFAQNKWFLKGKQFPMPNGAIVIMQYTGLKDKNGNEIYEGDIIRCYGGAYWNGIYEYNYVIEVRDIRDLNDIVHSENVEILGNKYENPELLEGRE